MDLILGPEWFPFSRKFCLQAPPQMPLCLEVKIPPDLILIIPWMWIPVDLVMDFLWKKFL